MFPVVFQSRSIVSHRFPMVSYGFYSFMWASNRAACLGKSPSTPYTSKNLTRNLLPMLVARGTAIFSTCTTLKVSFGRKPCDRNSPSTSYMSKIWQCRELRALAKGFWSDSSTCTALKETFLNRQRDWKTTENYRSLGETVRNHGKIMETIERDWKTTETIKTYVKSIENNGNHWKT